MDKEMSLFDSHIHLGQFYDLYSSPEYVSDFLCKIGVNGVAISSTTICEQRCRKVLREIELFNKIYHGVVINILWVTPEIIDNSQINILTSGNITWKCLKIHPELNPGAWLSHSKYIDYVLDLAQDIKAPILIHTSNDSTSKAASFKEIIHTHPDIQFILAHGRPITEAQELLTSHNNTWVDTAFMPIEDVVFLCRSNLSAKVLWGSDFPIQRYYFPENDYITDYQRKLYSIHDQISDVDFENITHCNFEKLFSA